MSCSLPARVFVESTQLGEMERSKTPCYRGCSNPGHASLSFKFRHVTAVGSNPTSCNVFVCFYFSACPLALIMLDARCDCRQVGGFSSLPCIRRLCSCCCQPLGRLAGDAAAGSGVLLSGVNVGTPCTATAALPPATCCTRGAGPALLHCKNRSRHFDDHSMANFYYNIVVTAT